MIFSLAIPKMMDNSLSRVVCEPAWGISVFNFLSVCCKILRMVNAIVPLSGDVNADNFKYKKSWVGRGKEAEIIKGGKDA